MTGVCFVIETVPITSAGDKIEARELFKFLTDRVKRHTGFSFNRPDMKFSTPVVKKQLKDISPYPGREDFAKNVHEKCGLNHIRHLSPVLCTNTSTVLWLQEDSSGGNLRLYLGITISQ